jgi:glutathione S-transferase
MHNPLTHLLPLVVFLNVLLLFWVMFEVGRSRAKTGVKAPATSGHPDFERAFRVQMNTIEQTVIFLPTLWLCSTYYRADLAAVLGFIWITGRIWYALGYLKSASQRGGGFMVAMAAWGVLLGAGFYGYVMLLISAYRN